MSHKIEDLGLKKWTMYSIYAVAPYLEGGYREFSLPTEVVVDEPQFVVPQRGRVWHTSIIDRAEEGEYPEPIVAVELYDESGDDGHTDYMMSGVMLVSQKEVHELRNAPHPYREGKKWQICFAVLNEAEKITGIPRWEMRPLDRSTLLAALNGKDRQILDLRVKNLTLGRKLSEMERDEQED